MHGWVLSSSAELLQPPQLLVSPAECRQSPELTQRATAQPSTSLLCWCPLLPLCFHHSRAEENSPACAKESSLDGHTALWLTSYILAWCKKGSKSVRLLLVGSPQLVTDRTRTLATQGDWRVLFCLYQKSMERKWQMEISWDFVLCKSWVKVVLRHKPHKHTTIFKASALHHLTRNAVWALHGFIPSSWPLATCFPAFVTPHSPACVITHW